PRILFFATPGTTNDTSPLSSNIRINEFMADNRSTKSNSVGEFEDWFELYNAGSNAVNLAGYSLTDDITDPFQYVIPNGVMLNPGDHLLIWADGNSEDEMFDLHTNFKLGAGGEELAIFDNSATLLDWVVFGDQEEDFSEGLYPDGSDQRFEMSIPTPGTTNVLFAISSIVEMTNGMMQLKWHSREGWTYDVFYRDAYSNNAPWTLLAPNIIAPGRKTTLTIPTTSTTDRRYFRVRQQ
ncbi:MAG: lamin tail domain-containing protein, partial [Verrucomicrobiota bacterium]